MGWRTGDIIISDEQKERALSIGLDRLTVVNRIENLEWDVERAVSEEKHPRGAVKGKYTKADIEEAKRNKIGEKTFTSRVLTYNYSIERAKTEPVMRRGRGAKK